eukprot:871010-Amphidinium_carterae.2
MVHSIVNKLRVQAPIDSSCGRPKAQNVFDNLHGIVPKGQVTAMLDAMAADGRLLMKVHLDVANAVLSHEMATLKPP